MEWSQFSAFVVFAVVFYGTPGPATISLTASGSAFGFRKSLPYLSGIIVGLFSNLAIAALGLVYLLTQYPTVQAVLSYVCLLYIFYLAYKIATGGRLDVAEAKPLGFFQGVLLNLLNPKAYLGAIAVLTQFAEPGPGYAERVVLLVSVIMILGILIDVAWCYGGAVLSKPFASPRATQALNISLAVLLVGSVLIATFAS